MGLNIAKSVFQVAVALRQSLIELSNSRSVQQGQETKMERVYQYLIGQLAATVQNLKTIASHLWKPPPNHSAYCTA